MNRLLGYFLLIAIILSSNPLSAKAESNFNPEMSMGSFQCGNPVITDEVDKALDDYIENDANMAEKFLTSQAQNFFNIGDINGISTLIFGNPYCVWNSDLGSPATMSANGIFTDEEMQKIIKPIVRLLGSVFVILMTIAFLVSGLKIMGNSVRARGMADFWEDASSWFFAIALGVFYFDFLNLIFETNAAIVLSIRDLISNLSGNALNGFSVMSKMTDFLNFGTMGSFLLVIVAEWILAVVLNIVYISRKVIILMLIIMGIVAIYSLMFKKTRGFFGVWLREFCGNVFLQSIHAIVFFAVIQFVEMGAGVFFKLVLMMMFLPVSGMISKWLNFGDSSSKIGSALTMVGLGGAVSTMFLASQASNIVRGGSFNQGGSFNSFGGSGGFGGPGGGGGGGGLTNLANSTANDMAATSISMRALGNSDSTMFNLSKESGGKLGQFVGGGAGMILGPAGVAAGVKVGDAIGQGIPQIGRNLGVGLGELKNTISSMSNFQGANGETGFKGLFGNTPANNSFETLSARRQSMANLGESVGLMVAGQKGASLMRSLGGAMSGVSRQRLNTANAMGLASNLNMDGVNGAISLAQLAQKFPNADGKWVQTNQGSAFHVNTGDGFKQVGITGSADGSLLDGQARVMDFKLADSSLNYAVQPNGAYKPDSDLLKANLADIASQESLLTGFEGTSASPLSDSTGTHMSLGDLGGANGDIPTFDQSLMSGNVMNGDSSTESSIISDIASSSAHENMAAGGSAIPSFNDSIMGEQPTVSDSTSAMNIAATQQDASAGGSAIPSFNDSVMGEQSSPGYTQHAPTSVSTDLTGSENVKLSAIPKPATIGLQGSTPSVMRTSEAYIVNGVDTSNTSKVAQESTNKEITKVQDSSFQPRSINPDAYVFQGVNGSKVSTSDRVAENVQKTGSSTSHWASKMKEKRMAKIEKKRMVR